MYRTVLDMPLRFKFWMVNGFSFVGMCVLSMYAITKSFEQVSPDGSFGSAEYWSYFSEQALGYAIWVFVLMCLVLASSQVLISFVHRHVSILKKAMRQSAKSGDLKVRVPEDCKDEIGQMAASFNYMQETLFTIVSDVQKVSAQVNQVADEFIQQTEIACSTMLRQQENSSRVMNEMESLKLSSGQVLDSAHQAKGTSGRAEEVLLEGRSSIEEVISTTKVVAGDFQHNSAQINKLAEDSNSISGFVEVIRSISEQTNLLALNAAIEAARAGEQGRGFAVVADEVRSLASKTHEATDKIGDILAKFSDLTNRVVEGMNTSAEHVESSVGHADLAQDSFKKIAESVTELAGSNQIIEQEAQSQAESTENVFESVQNIASAASNTANVVGEVHAQAKSLSQVAKQLNEQMSRFQLN